jgi:hypothetical protein
VIEQVPQARLVVADEEVILGATLEESFAEHFAGEDVLIQRGSFILCAGAAP